MSASQASTPYGTSIAEAAAGGEMERLRELRDRFNAGDETGAIGYILMWLLGVPASLLFVVFLLRGCN
jgi:hypothetical protein